MARNKPIRADIWQGDWGIPSVDIDCLRLLTYAKFSGIELEVRKTNNPFRTPKGTLPVVYHGNHVYTSFEELVSYAKTKNICPDYGLSAKQNAEVAAYTNMLKEKLFPALQYVWWIDDKNHVNLTRPWYCKVMPFPLAFYYPNKYLKQAKAMMEALYEEIDNEAEIESRVYSAAEKCLTSLSTRLGDSDFMFGRQPTSLDATLYAYLAPLLKAPFPNNTLQNHLKACTNLHKFVSRITQRYYPKDNQEYETKRQEQMKDNQQNSDDFPHKRRNQILAGLFAVCAMSLYAVSSGIVQNSSDGYSDTMFEPSIYDHGDLNEEE